jgi:SAM-dependent methyltransferase/NRPS condensation-like uncharacterized protein/acyl carrier protein
VLEIGCGTGLVFYQLAGKVNNYIGTDFSKASIDLISRRIQKGLRDYGPVELKVAAAHEISIPETEEVDTIVMNSIVQYFPGEQYMNEVITKCISLLKGKGRIIIGDVRDNRLLESFKGRLQLQQMVHSANIREFKWAVEQEVLKEEELCFDPAYFFRLPSIHPGITHVEIKWKEADNVNELTLYRFNVVIHVGDVVKLERPRWQDYNDPAAMQILTKQLEENEPIIAVKDAPNFRLWQEQLLVKAMDEKLVSSVGELATFIAQENTSNGEIEKLLLLARSKNYHTRLLLNEDSFKINIVMESHFSGSGIVQPFHAENEQVFSYTNVPLFNDISLSLQKDLKRVLKQRLPEYMVPAELVALIQLPLTNNGKIDRRFLSLREEKAVLNTINFQAPTTAIEQTLANIWQELLDIGQVGIYDNFFELGGHSLLAMRLVSAIRKQLQMEIAIKTLFNHPTIAALASHLQTHHKDLLLPPIEAVARPELIPLSFSQERLWFIDRLEGSLPYHIPTVLRLKGILNEDALKFALVNIVKRHEVLRTVILENESGPYQHIMPEGGSHLSILDGALYQHDPKGMQLTIQQLINQPFDLSADHMLRAALIQLNEQEHMLVVTMHHIASDGWSISVIVKEVVELYNAYNEGRQVQLTPLKVQYADYAIWQRKYLKGEVLEMSIHYWKEKLNEVPPLQLPLDHPRPAVQSTRGAIVNFQVNKQLSAAIQSLSQQQGTTLFMTLLATIKVLLYKYSGQQDICIGSPIAGRQHQEVENLIGFFINTIALRTEIKTGISFASFLQEVKDTTLEAYAHQELPFEKVVETVVKDRDLSRSPLFQVMFILQNTPDIPVLQLGEVQLTNEATGQNTAKYELSFNMAQTSNGLQGTIEYCTDLFNEQTICRMIGHFNELLQAIVQTPRQKIELLPILSKAEEDQLLIDFNNTTKGLSSHKTIIDLFEEQVTKTPDAIAVLFEEKQLSYCELHQRSNQLAHYLVSKGIGKESLVPICIERGMEMIIGLLAVLKAGAAFVPG